ncbi:hypothetical protein FQR65_LT06929 [Abscondita terminalis]|nr:hypothetical protein FQR65_LT06929 [Abscondita terminalis]
MGSVEDKVIWKQKSYGIWKKEEKEEGGREESTIDYASVDDDVMEEIGEFMMVEEKESEYLTLQLVLKEKEEKRRNSIKGEKDMH